MYPCMHETCKYPVPPGYETALWQVADVQEATTTVPDKMPGSGRFLFAADDVYCTYGRSMCIHVHMYMHAGSCMHMACPFDMNDLLHVEATVNPGFVSDVEVIN